MTAYRTQLQLGKRYRDRTTGLEGKCVAVTFWEHGCERATLKHLNKLGEVVDTAFDAPELELIADPPKAVKLIERKTGGPHDRVGAQRR